MDRHRNKSNHHHTPTHPPSRRNQLPIPPINIPPRDTHEPRDTTNHEANRQWKLVHHRKQINSPPGGHTHTHPTISNTKSESGPCNLSLQCIGLDWRRTAQTVTWRSRDVRSRERTSYGKHSRDGSSKTSGRQSTRGLRNRMSSNNTR